MNRLSQPRQRQPQPGQTTTTTNTNTNSSRLVWIGAAVVATVAWSLQLGASLTCAFVTVEAHDGEILAITADSAQVAQRSTSLGLQCSGDFYHLEDDHHWKLARSFSLVALAVGVVAWLWTVWNGMVALIVTKKRSDDTSNTRDNNHNSNNDDTTPSSWTTTSVAVVSCLAALLQLPALVVWESFPCTDFVTQQECRWAVGSSVWVCSVVAWVAVALVVVQGSRIRDCVSSAAAASRRPQRSRSSTTGTGGPWWSRVVVLPKLAPADTTWEEDDDDDDQDVERGGMEVVREYDPIFAAGFCQSDDDPADTRKQRGGGGTWSKRLRIGNWWQRLAAPHSQSPSQSGPSSAEASISPSLTSTSTTRIVKRYSFAVPPAVLAAAHQMGRRSVEEQDEQDEEEPGKNDTPNKNDKDDQADSWYATPWSTPWFPTAFSASNEDHNNNNDDPPSDEEDDRHQEARVHHNRSLSTTSLISAHESMLDTLTGEESLLDHDDDDSSSSSSLERNRDRANGLAPNQEEEEDQESLALDKEDEEKDFGPHPFSTNTDQLQPELTEPRVVHLPDNHNNNNNKATDPTTTSTNNTGRLPRPGIFARLQRYKRLGSDDDDDDDDDKCLPIDNDDDDSPPPMMEVTFQTNSSEETSSSAASSPERHLKLLSEEWKDLFQEEEDPAQEMRDPDLERRTGDNDDDMLEMDPAGPPSICTDGSEDDESEPEPYFSSSEPETDDDDDDDNASPRRGRRRAKVLHPPRRRRRYHTGTTGSSVSSNHSLLSCTIQEETEEDLQQEKGGASGDPTSPNSTERRSRSPQPSILRRTQSSPDLSRLHQAATDSTMTSDSPTYLKDHSAAAANRHDDDDDDMGTLGTNPSSIWTGPRQLSMSSSQDQRSSQDQDAAVVANHTKDDDDKSASPSSVSTGPHLRKRRSQSLEVRRKRPLVERGTTTNLWKRELEHRASIHHTRSYLSSSSSSSSSASSEAPETTQEDAEATSPRGRARRARVQRLQQEQSRRLGQSIGSSSSRGRRNSPTYTRALTPKRYLAASPTRAVAVVSPNSTPKRGSGRRGRTASPSVQDRSYSSTASDHEPRATVDPSESFLLDSLDLSLARSARKQGHEYGSDEDSI